MSNKKKRFFPMILFTVYYYYLNLLNKYLEKENDN